MTFAESIALVCDINENIYVMGFGSDTCPEDETATPRRFPFNIMYIRF